MKSQVDTVTPLLERLRKDTGLLVSVEKLNLRAETEQPFYLKIKLTTHTGWVVGFSEWVWDDEKPESSNVWRVTTVDPFGTKDLK